MYHLLGLTSLTAIFVSGLHQGGTAMLDSTSVTELAGYALASHAVAGCFTAMAYLASRRQKGL